MSETYMTERSSASTQIASWGDTGNVFQPLALRAMFWRPTYLETSAWLEHIPFAFWLVEAHQPRLFVELGTHHGASYFAFCQAVDRLGLDAQCFAVDTWKGDEHAGFYDEQVFEKVKAHNAAQYSGFSRLVRSTFDEAIRHFSDGSIDLLHIDGLHTLEAVRHDFDTWLPKLSKRGVVVMHDTNVRERNFGVFKLFEQIKAQYPTFEFVHGHGLGVVGVGPDQEERLKHLFKSNESEPAKRSIHEVFSRLGLACADSLASAQQQARARKLEEEVNKQKKQLEETKQSLEKTKADLNTRSKELADARAKVQTQIEHHAMEKGQLAERATLLQEIRIELKEEVGRLQSRIDATSIELSQRIQTLARLEEASTRYQLQCNSLSEELQSRDESIGELRRQAQKLQAEMGSLQALLRERDWELIQVKSAQQTQGIESAQLREERARLMEQQAASQQQLQALSEEVQTLRHSIGTLRDETQQYKTAAEASQEQLVERERELVAERGMREAQARELSHLRESGTSQSAKIESLTQALAHRDRELGSSQAEVVERREEAADLKQALERRIGEIETLNAALFKSNQDTVDVSRRYSEAQILSRQREEAIVLLEKKVAESESAIARLLQDGERSQELLKELQAGQESKVAEVQRLNLEKAILQADKDKQALMVEETLVSAEKARAEAEQKHAISQEKLVVRLKAQEGDLERLEREQLTLQSDKESLARKLEERFKEVGTLTQMLTAQEGQVQQLQKDKTALNAEKESLAHQLRLKVNVAEKASVEHAKALEHVQAKLKAQEAEVQRLVREKAALQDDKDTLTRKLEERFKEVATLTKMLDTSDKARAEAERRHAEEQEELLSKLKASEAEAAQLLAHKQSESSKWPLRLFARGGKGLGRKEKRKIACQLQLVKQCDLFDETWYLARYPDIAQTKVDPLEHYLRFGAAEGRDPGPLFSTESYIRAYPDVAASAINPLVHYIQHGRQEGRTIERAKR